MFTCVPVSTDLLVHESIDVWFECNQVGHILQILHLGIQRFIDLANQLHRMSLYLSLHDSFYRPIHEQTQTDGRHDGKKQK
ncbi:hypothetical protein D3C75_1326100 [compost metagenome]